MATIQVPTNFQDSITPANSPVVLNVAETHGTVIRGLFVANQGLGAFQFEISSEGDAYGDPIILLPGDEYEIDASRQIGNNVIVNKVRITLADSSTQYLVSASSVVSKYATGVRKTDKVQLTTDVQKDSNDPRIEYVGTAVPGTLSSESLWQIRRIDCNTGTVVMYADGNANYDNIFDNRESLIYG